MASGAGQGLNGLAPAAYQDHTMLGLISTLIIGFIVGALAKVIVPGREPGGCLITSLIGIAGSFVAYFIGSALGWYQGDPNSLRPVGFLGSLIGAVILLAIYHFIRRRSGP